MISKKEVHPVKRATPKIRRILFNRVKHIAKLARLGLLPDELKKMEKELSAVLDYIEKLKEVDVSNVKPTSHSIQIENVMREDKVKRQSRETVDRLVEMAPERRGRYIKVKAVFGL